MSVSRWLLPTVPLECSQVSTRFLIKKVYLHRWQRRARLRGWKPVRGRDSSLFALKLACAYARPLSFSLVIWTNQE